MPRPDSVRMQIAIRIHAKDGLRMELELVCNDLRLSPEKPNCRYEISNYGNQEIILSFKLFTCKYVNFDRGWLHMLCLARVASSVFNPVNEKSICIRKDHFWAIIKVFNGFQSISFLVPSFLYY